MCLRPNRTNIIKYSISIWLIVWINFLTPVTCPACARRTCWKGCASSMRCIVHIYANFTEYLQCACHMTSWIFKKKMQSWIEEVSWTVTSTNKPPSQYVFKLDKAPAVRSLVCSDLLYITEQSSVLMLNVLLCRINKCIVFDALYVDLYHIGHDKLFYRLIQSVKTSSIHHQMQ